MNRPLCLLTRFEKRTAYTRCGQEFKAQRGTDAQGCSGLPVTGWQARVSCDACLAETERLRFHREFSRALARWAYAS